MQLCECVWYICHEPSSQEREMIDVHLDCAVMNFWQTVRNSLGGDFSASACKSRKAKCQRHLKKRAITEQT